MLCIYTSDLHSRKTHFKRLLKLYEKHRPELIIIGGDLFEYTHDKEEQLRFLENYLKNFFTMFSVPIVILPGNCDWPVSIDTLDKLKPSNIHIINRDKFININGLKIRGYEYITPPPFSQKHWVKRDLKEDKVFVGENSYITDKNGEIIKVEADYLNKIPSIEEDLEDTFTSDSIWVTHNPPYGTNLDIIHENIHIGSKALLKKIQDLKPKLVLSGHVHESPIMSGKYIDNVGDTTCINPGQADRFHGVIFAIDNKGKLNHLEHTIYGEYKKD
ncbi:metallophosphoesterase family protein [Dethiothermospora halolimnae]|uniref:metallophosphoesterase family protein n=1 Tax=Dethiothermospora halolimnae TaxID=3114390 RepID=UPI003CCC4488